jgi:hypothetical protein
MDFILLEPMNRVWYLQNRHARLNTDVSEPRCFQGIPVLDVRNSFFDHLADVQHGLDVLELHSTISV